MRTINPPLQRFEFEAQWWSMRRLTNSEEDIECQFLFLLWEERGATIVVSKLPECVRLVVG